MDEGDKGDLMATIDVEVRGLIELQHKMTQMVNDLHGAPVLDAMRDSVLMVQGDAKQNVVVDTGRLRASIWPEVKANADSVTGIVGSNVVYAPYIEYGTRPHFPPVSAIQIWVHHKRMGGSVEEEYRIAFAIARAISKRGTKAQPYLEPAFKSNEAAIRRRFDHAIEVIVNK